jgi:hypothetical protein
MATNSILLVDDEVHKMQSRLKWNRSCPGHRTSFWAGRMEMRCD